MGYSHAKHVHGNWFVAGQFSSHDLQPLIVGGGFKTVINLREGTTSSQGKPSQGTTALLNIKDSQDTYIGNNKYY